MRSILMMIALIACKEPPAPPPPPPAEAPPQQVDVVGDPVVFSPLAPAATCTYELKEVATETLGDQLLAGHNITITYELRAKESKSPLALEAEVTRVQADAKRDTYTAKLDSLRAGDLLRIQGGADTVVMFEMVIPFAFLGKRVTFELDERGRLRAIQGASEVRKALMELHPPKPRKETHYQKKVEVALSDEAIAEYFVPGAVVIPKEGPVASGRQETISDVTFDLIDYVGRGSEGFRISIRPERWLLEQKRAFIGVKEVSSAVPPVEGPKMELLKGDRSVTVEFEPKSACFRRAGSAFNDLAMWSGMIKDAEVTTERKRSNTRIWTKQ